MSRLGLCLSGESSYEGLKRAVDAAEQSGYELAWLPEASFWRESSALLAALGERTSTIRLGTGILTVYTRTATLMAQLAFSMDEIMRERFVLGLGVGHGSHLLDNHGVELERPLQRMREYVHVIRETIAHGRLSFEGEVIRAPNLSFEIARPRGEVPIYLAALGSKMAALAGEVGDGALFNMGPTAYLADAVGGLREAARRSGRDPAAVEVAALVIAGIGPEGERVCRESIARWVSPEMPYYQQLLRESGFAAEVDRIGAALESGGIEAAGRAVSDELLDDVALAGDPATWADKIARLESAGVDLVCPYFRALGAGSEDAVLEGIRAAAAAWI